MNTTGEYSNLSFKDGGSQIRVSKKHASYLLFTTFLAMFLGWTAGYRPLGPGLDFANYERFYSSIHNDLFLQESRFEQGFKHIAYFATNTLNLDVMTFVASLMSMSLIAKFYIFGHLRYSWAAILFYVLLWFPLYENTQIRAAMAITVLFFATKPLFEGRWVRYLLISSLAILFHYSSIFAIGALAAAFYISQFRGFIWFTIVLSAGASMYAFFPILLSYVLIFRVTLLDGIGDSSPPNIFSLLNVLTCLFLIATFFSGSLRTREAKSYFIMTCFSLAVLVAFQDVPVLANRLREILFVFITFIAFEYKFTLRNLPQAILAFSLALWGGYSSVQYGLFSG